MSYTTYQAIAAAPKPARSNYPLYKRGLDILTATLGLLLLGPLLLVTLLVIWLDSPGPALFSQTRVGAQGRRFRCWKFRSMHADAEARKAQLADANEMEGGVLFKIKEDPRVTRVGRILRKTSIDELPQLWNVLNGDMSLVGPRPPVPAEYEQYSDHEKKRLQVKPGITCFWQVSGRSDLPFPEQVRLDLHYAEVRSLWVDLKILVRTIPAVIFARGAY